MWFVSEKVSHTAVENYQQDLHASTPRYIVIDGLFNADVMESIVSVLRMSSGWETQKHTYSELYVNDVQWENATTEQQFVKRDVWSCKDNDSGANLAKYFLAFLRSDEFMSLLSRIFQLHLTDITVAEPKMNTNYFRLGATDFVEQHADESPGREVCMLLYLNEGWKPGDGGELCFLSNENESPITIDPKHNRCVLFDPSSEGSEHWVKKLNSEYTDKYRYNVTSWYWSE